MLGQEELVRTPCGRNRERAVQAENGETETKQESEVAKDRLKM